MILRKENKAPNECIMNAVEIIEYEDQYQPIFKALNVEWLDQYNLTEKHDLQILDAPREMILNAGGFIYLAKCNNQIVGSTAIMKEHDGVYELAKMTVAKDFRKMGISKKLMDRCKAKAIELKATRITLYSNHQLKAALALYEQYGFKHIPIENSPFLTADVMMELKLE